MLRQKTKVKDGIADLVTNDGNIITAQEKTRLLNDFLSSVFTKESTNNIPISENKQLHSTLEHINISNEQVLKILNRLKLIN